MTWDIPQWAPSEPVSAAPARACLHCGAAVMAERGFYELTLQPFGAAGGCLWTLCTLVCLQAFVAGGGL